VLRRDGAELVLLDVPALSADLRAVANRLEAETIELDITDEDAPATIAERLSDGVDVVVHNAGVTRDRTIAKMPEDRWTSLMEINLSSEERIDDELLRRDLPRPNGRIVCVSSMSGIAGRPRPATRPRRPADRRSGAARSWRSGGDVNAVAPGFIETRMTDAMPAIRKAGPMNSLARERPAGRRRRDDRLVRQPRLDRRKRQRRRSAARACWEPDDDADARQLAVILPLYARAAQLIPALRDCHSCGRGGTYRTSSSASPGAPAEAVGLRRVCGFALRSSPPTRTCSPSPCTWR
jgi:NAD(P)-dependent dehydrogenase (short-subunit alcohol dehydrogenase family)